VNTSSGSSIDSIGNVRKLGDRRESASAALLERSAAIDELADILKRRNIRTIYYFHADHYEPWSLGLNERTAAGVERFGQMSLASPFARRMSLFYSAYVPYNLDVTENQRAVGRRVAGDSVYFHSRTDKQEELAQSTIRPLFEPGAHEAHLHVHHEFWTRNESHFDTAVSKWVNANSTAAMDRERLDLCFTLSREIIGRELGRPFDRWAFVHGNWALAASDPLICTIENELGMIMRHGGFGDFSFPAGRAYCDPKLQSPFTCRPLDGKRPYDDPASDPVPLAAGSGVLSSDRFFIWNSPIKAQYSSLDYYSEPNRELFKQSARILSEWLGNSVAFGPDLYIKTHAHSMKWEYEIFKPDSQIPHLYPDVVNIFEELLRVCDKAGVEFRLATVNEVMQNLEALDQGPVVDATSIKPTFEPTSAGSPVEPNDKGAIDSLAASESFITEKLRAWVHADDQRLEEAGSFYLKLLGGRQVLQDYERATLDYLLENVPPDGTTILEVGIGYGVLSLLLAKAGYHVIACEGSRGRLDGFKFLVESLDRHVPGIADRVTAVQGWFPDAFDPAMLPVGRRSVLLTTNIVSLESDERQAEILETARLFDDFIVDTTRFGIPRCDEDEAGEVYEAISRDWRLVARVWRCKPNQIWHFESQKSVAMAMTQKQLEGERRPVELGSFNEELVELQRHWLAGEGKEFDGDDLYVSKIARGASLEAYETAVASKIVRDFERESTTVVEVGSGYGALALLLGRHGFAVQSFEGDRRRTAAAAWLYGQYSERYPGMAGRIRFVLGFFPEVSQLEAASPGVRRLCVATNVTCTYTAKNQDLILDHFAACDELILDLGRFGVNRNGQAERDTLRNRIEDRDFEAVDRMYFAAPYEYWHFRKKKASDGLVGDGAASPRTSERDTHSPFPVRDRHGVLYSVFGDKRLLQCPVCGAASEREIWRIPMSSFKEPGSASVNYYRQFPALQVPADIYCFDFCDGCQSVYLNPVDGNRKQNFRRSAEYIDSMRDDGAWQGYERIFDRFAKWLPRNASVMVDAACGIGQYLEVARRRMPDRWQKLIGLELSENYVHHMRDCKLEAHVLDLDTEPLVDIVAPGSVDVVFFCDAFQHVERPMLVLRKLLTSLRPGGRLFLTAQRYGRDVQAAVGPSELIYVGEAFLERLPREVGCRIVDTGTTAMRYYIVLEK